MDRREDALREALQTNIKETQRWQTYLKDNETAIENLATFGKRLTVDVMVPMGKKAFMPGHLLHTNEVLVGHYQGYFSKCTSSKAREICEFRIKMAKEHLKKLETESELWQNKLEKPYAEGVMPSADEREIIEDFNEENEKLWNEQHRIRVKQAKQKERETREIELQKQREKSNKKEQAKEKSEQDVFKMLEDAEIMEELEQELETLEVDEVNDDTIRKLMSGEMKLPEEKKRSAHDKDKIEKNKPDGTPLINIVKKNELWQSNVPATNNNVQPNPELLSEFLNSNDEEENEEEPLPEEVNIIKEQAKFLNAEDQIGFYEYQIEIIRQKIQALPLRTPVELNEKIRLLQVLEHVEELLELAEETVGAEELAKQETELEEIETKENLQNQENATTTPPSNKETSSIKLAATNDKPKLTQKRRISFALEDQTLEFRKHEAVTQMLPSKLEKPPQRDIIKLNDDDNDGLKDKLIKNIKLPSPSKSKMDLIQAKVNSNLQFVSENQSKQDFDLVQQILQTSNGEINTLNIKFKHSKQKCTARDNKETLEIPGSPADFYDRYLKSQESLKEEEPTTLFINSYEGEDKVKAPVLKEADRHVVFVDPKSEFSNPALQAKSILKNKSEVDKENHQKNPQQQENINKNKKSKKKSTQKSEDDDNFSAYNKVMNEVVEKPPLTEPEPLPNVKFIDAHTPKKRVSRFKQMRQGSEKT